MHKPHVTRGLLLAAALLLMPGCVELTGQRITWSYDPAKDELQILIFYDGIHDSGKNAPGSGTVQVPTFVSEGNIMLLDWPAHLSMPRVRSLAQNQNAKPLERDWGKLLTSLKTQPVGYYREPDGRIGALQLVTIPNAKAFVRQLNTLISRSILEDKIRPDEPLMRTRQKMQAVAKGDYPWVTLDGHAIRLSVPVHPQEWARAKAAFLGGAAEGVVRLLGEKGTDQDRKNFVFALRALGAAPVSFIDEGDRVEFVLGRVDAPSTFRLQIRDEYEPSLEKVVAEAVKVDLDKALAAALLKTETNPPAPIATVLKWGPPEESVRGLMAAAQDGNDEQRKAALDLLDTWAGQWNRDHGIPKTPEKKDPPEDYLAAWKKWYHEMRQFPISAEEWAEELREFLKSSEHRAPKKEVQKEDP